MGAPVIITEKLVSGNETRLAYEALQRVLVSGLYTGEGGEGGEGREGREEGKMGNERVRVREKELSGGKKIWVADTDDLQKIDISNPANIEMVSVCCTCIYMAIILLNRQYNSNVQISPKVAFYLKH